MQLKHAIRQIYLMLYEFMSVIGDKIFVLGEKMYIFIFFFDDQSRNNPQNATFLE